MSSDAHENENTFLLPHPASHLARDATTNEAIAIPFNLMLDEVNIASHHIIGNQVHAAQVSEIKHSTDRRDPAQTRAHVRNINKHVRHCLTDSQHCQHECHDERLWQVLRLQFFRSHSEASPPMMISSTQIAACVRIPKSTCTHNTPQNSTLILCPATDCDEHHGTLLLNVVNNRTRVDLRIEVCSMRLNTSKCISLFQLFAGSPPTSKNKRD